MEIALPHIVVRSCGAGIGTELVAALSAHPFEVSEARDLAEAHRVAGGRPAVLVVVVAPYDPRRWIAETNTEFRGVPILLVSDSPDAPAQGLTLADAAITSIPESLPLPDICWHVTEAISRATRRPGITGHPLGPHAIDIDSAGVIGHAGDPSDGWLIEGHPLRRGDSILPMIAPNDRDMFTRVIERSAGGGVQFVTVRILDSRGNMHTVQMGLRANDGGRITLLVQPLIFGGPIVGRHINIRDPITGLLTRWAMSNMLAERECGTEDPDDAALLLLKLDDFSAIGNFIGSRQTDLSLVRVASALTQIFPWPAVCSRLMGDAFLVFVSGREAVSQLEAGAERIIALTNAIDLPGFRPDYRFGASIGIAHVTNRDYDLAIRLAEAAASEAHAAGGNRTIVAGSAKFTRAQASELLASMDLGNWEMWLQPVTRSVQGPTVFHEALARFGTSQRRMASRSDFFLAGRAEGLLKRFDRMMLLRALELLAARPELTLSVNVSYETFVSDSFPDSFLQPCRESPGGCERIILEIAPRCLLMPRDMVRPRLLGLEAAGVAVAIDDFGSGICRLRDLTQYPIAFVKFDELVTGYVDDDPLQREFVRTVVNLCRARGITTVAEYTRSPEQMSKLVEDGVDLFQGELFGMPRPVAEVLPPLAAEAAHA